MGDAFLPSTVRFARKTIEWLKKRPTIYKFVYGLALRHDRAMDFRKYGLMRDDLIPEEHEIVYEAMKRLTDKEMFDRTFRLRRAVQLNMTKDVLPKEEWNPDVPYLWRHIEAIAHERKEKADFDTLVHTESNFGNTKDIQLVSISQTSGSRNEGYGGRFGGPYERSSGYRLRDGSRPRRLEDVFDTDELLTSEQISKYSEFDGICGETAYKEYVRRHRRLALERYFSRHKNEAWFVERYDPFKTESYFNKLKENARDRANVFIDGLENGKYNNLCLEDGQDLMVEGENVSTSEKSRSFPISMKLPERLYGAIEKKDNTIALSNISPMMTRDELETLFRDCSDRFLSLELGEPMSEKGNYRLGWATFEDNVELAPIVATIEARILHGEKIYCSAARTFSAQIRLADQYFSSSSRLIKEIENAKCVVEKLDSRNGIENPVFQLIKDKSEKQQLDTLLLYLRKVHFLCYYSGVLGHGPSDLCRTAGDLCIRTGGTETDDISQGSLDSFDQLIVDLVDRLTHRYEPFSEDSILEKHVAKVDEGRYRCVHCSKLFKGVDFVIKHLRLKHDDVTKKVTLETATLNAFLANPSFSTLLSLPSHHRRHSYSSERAPHRDHRDRNDYGNAQGSRDRDRHRRPPPPPKDAVQDPRKLRQYFDWDAPAVGDVEINYE